MISRLFDWIASETAIPVWALNTGFVIIGLMMAFFAVVGIMCCSFHGVLQERDGVK